MIVAGPARVQNAQHPKIEVVFAFDDDERACNLVCGASVVDSLLLRRFRFTSPCNVLQTWLR